MIRNIALDKDNVHKALVDAKIHHFDLRIKLKRLGPSQYSDGKTNYLIGDRMLELNKLSRSAMTHESPPR